MTAERPTKRHVPPPRGDVVVENVVPAIDGGRFAAKAVVGDPLLVTADVFAHGHDVVRAKIRYRAKGTRRWAEAAMMPLGNDAFAASVTAESPGSLEVEVAGAVDELATWARDARRRLDAGRPDDFDAPEGARLLAAAADDLDKDGGRALVSKLADRLSAGLDPETLDAVEAAAGVLAERRLPTRAAGSAARFAVTVDPPRAAFSAWYEMFPRSASPDPDRAGTLSDVVDRLDYVAEMGFDVLYLPPIHPIGTTARKGRNNASEAGPEDVGSPWAIGGPQGGHETVNEDLGTVADFEHLVSKARRRGIEVALDLAFQCSPDHPWVTAHPDWFRHRPDGTIACAENPPKRYADIYPIDFHTADREGLWQALYGVTRCWVDRGVRIFRVDNPHTKPFAFWEWLIAEIKTDTPDVIFLAEAFTRPKVMHRLAKLGFDQSYTYYTWRDEKWELTQYFEELADGIGPRYFRPNVWPNTPDILAKSLQAGGPPAFVTRFVMAAGLSASYGIYGPAFELLWDKAVAPGSEEYLDSEKYQIHHHDLASPRSLRELIARVNAARRGHPALQRDRGLRFLNVDNDHLLAWRKRDDSGRDVVIGVVNLDPQWTQSGYVDVELTDVGIAPGEVIAVHDVLSGSRFNWQAGRNFVLLDPDALPAHLLVLERRT
ncbi:MAG: maltotransferase domain-containing protein [Acidimicrobiales bacterium]